MINDDPNIRIIKTMKSLADSIHYAGGGISLETLFKMNLFDFIMQAAGPNNIRFTFHGNTESPPINDKGLKG